MNQVTTSEAFRAAVRRLLEKEGWGGHQKLADHAGISKQYLSGMLSGRQKISDEHKDAIADFFGYSVWDLLATGEILLSTGYWFPYQQHLSQIPLEARPLAICRYAARDAGLLHVEDWVLDECIRLWFGDTVTRYRDGRAPAPELYQTAYEFFYEFVRIINNSGVFFNKQKKFLKNGILLLTLY
jgi:transcriptional regulator with XRE-family HTH domain